MVYKMTSKIFVIFLLCKDTAIYDVDYNFILPNPEYDFLKIPSRSIYF